MGGKSWREVGDKGGLGNGVSFADGEEEGPGKGGEESVKGNVSKGVGGVFSRETCSVWTGRERSEEEGRSGVDGWGSGWESGVGEVGVGGDG